MVGSRPDLDSALLPDKLIMLHRSGRGDSQEGCRPQMELLEQHSWHLEQRSEQHLDGHSSPQEEKRGLEEDVDICNQGPLNLLCRCVTLIFTNGVLLKILFLLMFPLAAIASVSFVEAHGASASFTKVLIAIRLIARLLLFIPQICVVFSVSAILSYPDKKVSLADALSAVGRLWPPVLLTLLCLIAPSLGVGVVGLLLYHTEFVLGLMMYFALCLIILPIEICLFNFFLAVQANEYTGMADVICTALKSLPMLLYVIYLCVLFMGGVSVGQHFIYAELFPPQPIWVLLVLCLTFPFQLSLVIPVTEDVYGWSALRKSWKMLRSKRWVAFKLQTLIWLIIYLAIAASDWIWQSLPQSIHSHPYLVSLVKGMLHGSIISVGSLLLMGSETLLYFSCKALHKERFTEHSFFRTYVMQERYSFYQELGCEDFLDALDIFPASVFSSYRSSPDSFPYGSNTYGY